MRGLTITLFAGFAVACGPIRGQVIEGSGPSARPAGNVSLAIVRVTAAERRRCELVAQTEREGRALRETFADSLYRARGAVRNGTRQLDQRVTWNIENLAYGDPAAALIAARDSALALLPAQRVVWTGVTELDGRFRSSLLRPGTYRIEVANVVHEVDVGLGGESIVVPYRDFGLRYFGRECSVEPGELSREFRIVR